MTLTGARGRPARTALAGPRVRLEPLDPARHAADLFAAAQGGDPRSGTTSPTARSPTCPRSPRTWSSRPRPMTRCFYAVVVDGAARSASSATCASSPRTAASRSATSGSARRCSARPRPPRRSTCSRARRSTASATAASSGSATPPTTRSRRAAERFGFTFEGVFRQHMIVKGVNRDTAWYSILDGEWPAVRAGFEAWLDAVELRPDGRQRRRARVSSSGSEDAGEAEEPDAERDQREADRDDHHLVEHAAAAGRACARRASSAASVARWRSSSRPGQAAVQAVEVPRHLADDRHPDGQADQHEQIRAGARLRRVGDARGEVDQPDRDADPHHDRADGHQQHEDQGERRPG